MLSFLLTYNIVQLKTARTTLKMQRHFTDMNVAVHFPSFYIFVKAAVSVLSVLTVRKIQKINCRFLTLFAFFLVLLPCSIYDHAEILTFDPVIALNVLSFRNENLHYRCTQCTLSLSPSIAEGDRTPLVLDGNVNHVRNVCHCRTWLLLVTTSNFLLDSWLKFRERRAVNHFSLPGNDTLSGTYLSLGLSCLDDEDTFTSNRAVTLKLSFGFWHNLPASKHPEDNTEPRHNSVFYLSLHNML